MRTIGKIQLGKNKVTENFILDLQNRFKTHKNLKISILRSCCRDKKELEKIRDEIIKLLGKNFTAKAIGYTLALKKWRQKKE